jgi:hypothetical protein
MPAVSQINEIDQQIIVVIPAMIFINKNHPLNPTVAVSNMWNIKNHPLEPSSGQCIFHEVFFKDPTQTVPPGVVLKV